ncbi:MAG: hypothetical protein P8O16_12615 [Algoriphagus sp.]|uniref:hypothetical protein n=1 Tax=Algoriphagus sp. TaxID=1872435 RepID=UPI002621A3E8|nr:hypothetical protein [Algoriphagus sp.]MDG1278117.1 hypothetical protein [Algoriphagus sp.]
MTIQINSNYLEKYAQDYAELVCEKVFASKQFVTGQDIIGMTNSTQVNFFVIKRLFELWQLELEKLKSNPYFDYRDITVHEALTQFMNALSRRIKVERTYLEPLVKSSVMNSIILAIDPVSFYQEEIGKAEETMINEYLKENRKYYKWHLPVVSFLIDKAGFGHDRQAYLKAVSANFQVIKDSLESSNLLLATLGEIKAFDLDALLLKNDTVEVESPSPEEKSKEPEKSFFEEIPNQEEQEVEKLTQPDPMIKEALNSDGKLNAKRIKAKFERESYRGMKGMIGELSESLAINQRIMFSKELFEGNADLLKHALKSIDEAGSFVAAIDLLNSRFVNELNWEVDSEVVEEFLVLVYRKFDL